MSTEAQREIGAALLSQPLGDEDATTAIVKELDERGLLLTDPDARFRRARAWAMEMIRRVDLAEQFVLQPGLLRDVDRAELLEILRGDR